MDDSIVGRWQGHAGPSYPIRLEVAFRRDGTYCATALQPTGPETTQGRYTVVADPEPTIEFEWPSTGGGAPLTERLTITREGDRLRLHDQREDMVLTKQRDETTNPAA